MKRNLLLVAAILLTLGFTACGGDDGVKTIDVSSITVSPTTLTVAAGSNPTTLAVHVVPANATDKSVSWTSNHPEVASVADGVVTPLSEGTAVITAMAGTMSATCTVTVTPDPKKVAGITLDKTSLRLNPNALFDADTTLMPTITPATAVDKTVKWSSDKPAVATVDATGKVVAVGHGTATITATTNDGNKTATCSVRVTDVLTVGMGKLYISGKASVNAISVAVSGSDYYTYNTNGYAIWKNGTTKLYTAANGNSGSRNLTIHDGKFYICGSNSSHNYVNQLLCNDQLLVDSLNRPCTTYDYVDQVAFIGDNWYVCGVKNYKATIYRKGADTWTLPGTSGNSDAISMAVLGTDLYSVGRSSINGGIHGLVWKNDTLLKDFGELTTVNDIIVSGKDRYVTGSTIAGSHSVKAILWKNETELFSYTSGVNQQYFDGKRVVIDGNDIYFMVWTDIGGTQSCLLFKNQKLLYRLANGSCLALLSE